MNKSPEIQARINVVAKEMANGGNRETIIAKYGKKWRIASRTIDRYIKEARQKAQELQQAASKAADEVFIKTKAEGAESAIMSRMERLITLTRIATGELKNEIKKPAWNNQAKKFEIITVNEKPGDNAIIKAIAEMNKMEGDYSPDKIDVNGTISSIDLNSLPPEKLKILLAAKKVLNG